MAVCPALRESPGLRALVLGPGPTAGGTYSRPIAALPRGPEFAVVWPGLKSRYRRLCDRGEGRFLVNQREAGRPRGYPPVAIGHTWGDVDAADGDDTGRPHSDERPGTGLGILCRVYMFHAHCAMREGGVLPGVGPNQEIKVFAAGVQAFVFSERQAAKLDVRCVRGRASAGTRPSSRSTGPGSCQAPERLLVRLPTRRRWATCWRPRRWIGRSNNRR